MAKHQANLAVAKQGDAELLFMGDSITDFWRNPEGNYAGKPVLDKHFGQWKVANFGIAGDTTQGVLYRLQNGEGKGFSPRAIMLMIGTNNTARNTAAEIAEGIGAVVLRAAARFSAGEDPAARHLPARPAERSGPRHDRRDQPDHREARTTASSVHYLDIGAGLPGRRRQHPGRRDERSACIPTTKGYEIWAKAVEEPLAKLMK